MAPHVVTVDNWLLTRLCFTSLVCQNVGHSVCLLLLFVDPSPLSLQIYAQKESQRSGYIELALQAYEQRAAESSAA